MRQIRCPICDALWFKMEDRSLMNAVVMESWPHVMKTAEGSGISMAGIEDTEMVNSFVRII
jgi:uncharacterized protein YqfA (UPF0365 family)